MADALTKTPLRRGMHVERTALLIGDSAIFSLQVERMIREANNPNRRAFRNGYELEPSVVPHLKTWVIWERRWAGCESPRRSDAVASLRSGDEADSLPPPQSTHVFK